MTGGDGFGSAAALELVVGGVAHRGWKAMKASLSLDAPAAKVSLDLADRWSDLAEPPPLRPGAACQLRLEGEVVIDGWIDAVCPSYDERDHLVTVVARDRLADLVDCAAVLDGPHEWAGLRLEEVAARLAAPFGVTVRSEVGPTPPFPRFAIQPGETAWEALERAARARGVLLAGDGRGGLRLLRTAAAAPGAGPVVLGWNVRRARAEFDHSNRFSVVCVRGQCEGPMADGVYAGSPPALAAGGEGLLAARGQGRAADPSVGRHRPRVLITDAAGDAAGFAERAAWEVRSAAGRGTRVAYVVPGWRGATGRLWSTATVVAVKDAYLGLSAELLVCGVTFSLSEEGSLTELELTRPDAYDIQAVPLKPAPGPRPAPAAPDGAVWTRERTPGAGQFERVPDAEIPRAPGGTP